ncbi:MAG: restriction endonuclease subunit S [Methylococcaceae bacterium]
MLDIITDNLDVWTTAKKNKKAVGRGSSKKQEAYGVKKLRELILELAVRGKLVPQDDSDEPASVLLDRIAEEKTRLIEERKIRKFKELPKINKQDELWPLPQGWAFVRFGNATFNRDAERIPLSVAERSGRQGEYDYYGTSGVIDTIDKYLFEKELLLIGEDGANLINRSTPIAFMARGKYWVNNHAHVIDGISEGLLLYICLHINAISLEQYVTGTAQPKMNQTKMNSIILALPPLAEQHRIVAKVNELMALCDQLEQQQSDQSATHQTLVETLLNGLIESAKTSANDQQSTADFFNQLIAQHFDTLFTTDQSIDQLKQTILQLAVMGKLVPQDPKDEPASVLLEKIAEEKIRLIEAGKIKKQKALPEIGEDEKPFELPNGWEWIRLFDISELITSGSRGWAKYYSDQGAIFVTMGNLARDSYELRMDTIRYVSPPSGGEGSRTELIENDLVISITGDVGNLGLIPQNFGEAYINQHACLLRFLPDCRNYYWPEFMRSPLAKLQFNAPQRGIKNSFRLGDIGGMVASMPPLAEQHRIATKVNQLLTLCDTLKANLNQAQTTQTQLADAIVKQAVN